MSALDFNVQPLETIADLKGRVDIADFVGRYVKLKRSGADYGGLCPFHAERTPSFQVSPRWQNFKCWGCGVAGDVIDFVGALENLSPGEAIGRFRELVGGAALDPAAVAAQAARRAALAAQEAQDAARNTALARRIWSEAEYLTRRSDPLPVAYLRERRGSRDGTPTPCAGTPLALGARSASAASSRLSRTWPAIWSPSGASVP